MASWIGPALVAPLWGIGSAGLVVRGWLATASFWIAILALLRGRMSPSHAFSAIVGAFLAGLICSVLLKGSFWLLVEVLTFGRTLLEQVIYWMFVSAAAAFLVRRLPSQLKKSWDAAMSRAS